MANILSALLTPTIAIITVLILYRQWQTGNDAHKFNLYEKRYPVWKALKDALEEIQKESTISEKGLNQLIIKTLERKFLFDSDITDYIENFREKALHLYHLNQPTKYHRNADEAKNLQQWFEEQHHESVNKFLPYLKFKK